MINDHSLVPNAVEECLRYEAPIQSFGRFARVDTLLGGEKIAQGHRVFVMIGAANRDSTANDKPNEFSIRREKINHLSFGYGIHLCLGARLARLETQLAFSELVDRLPGLALVDREVRWQTVPGMRGLESLRVGG